MHQESLPYDRHTAPPHLRERAGYVSHLSPFDRLLGSILLCLALVSGTTLLYRTNQSILDEVPREGGMHTEAIVGTPRFINPLLAVTDADKDLTAVTYAGLMTRDHLGQLKPLLASGYTLSEDGRTYTFTLHEGLTFHDGAPLTAADVAFTIERAANPAVRSPHYANWNGITVETPDARTVQITLPEPYTPFLENTTIGILPKHLWGTLLPDELPFSQLNSIPIGSGPYQVAEVKRDTSGIPTTYTLKSFSGFVAGKPHIRTLVFRLYKTGSDAIAAFVDHKVDALSRVGHTEVTALTQGPEVPTVHRATLQRTFSVYLNHNRQALFLHDEVREALALATPRQALVDRILGGYGEVLEGPLSPSLMSALDATSVASPEENTTGALPLGEEAASSTPGLMEAREVLEEKGWSLGDDGVYTRTNDDEVTERLAFTLTTVDDPELSQAAEIIATSWRELGAEVEVKIYDSTDLTQSIIRPRRYEALLFGTVLGHELDLYAFWHSSQRNDPGLNVAQYADIDADALLEQARSEHDPTKRAALITTFAERAREQHAAVFLYAPYFLYLMHPGTNNVALHPLTEASERFDSIHEWYVETDRVWSFVAELLR